MMTTVLHKRGVASALVVIAVTAMALPQVLPAQTSGSHLSLAQRVERLEQQQSQGGIGLVNQVQQLQTQVQQLQGRIEELEHEVELLRQANKDQYIDVDSRLRRLEGRAPAASGSAADAPADSTVQVPDVPLEQSDVNAPQPGGANIGSNVVQGDPQADYENAFGALRSGNFASASRLFKSFIQKYPNNELTANAYYWLGESYYGTQNYEVALNTFQELLKRFPDDAKASGALLKVGYCQFELQRLDQARATLEQVQQAYPGSREAKLAAGRLRALGLQNRG